jgi:hypothetical protein
VGQQKTKVPVSEASISAVIIRGDGTRETLGTIAYYHKNPLRRWWWQVKNSKLAKLLRPKKT